MRFVLTILLLILFSCCPEVTKEEKIKIDSIYIEKIIRDTISITIEPEIVYIDTTKFEIKPFFVLIDSIYNVNQKKTKVRSKFTMWNPDSSEMKVDIEELTGDKSMTVSTTKLHTIKEVVEEKTPVMDFILFAISGFIIGYVLGKLIK